MQLNYKPTKALRSLFLWLSWCKNLPGPLTLHSCFMFILLFLYTRRFRRKHHSIFRYRLTKNGFTDPKSVRGVRETGPWSRSVSQIKHRRKYCVDLSGKCKIYVKFIISIETWTAVRKMRLELKQPKMDKYQVEALIF